MKTRPFIWKTLLHNKWTLAPQIVTGIIAIRQALDFSTGKAVLPAVIGWLVLVIPLTVLLAALLAAASVTTV